MPIHLGKSGWNEILGKAARYPALEGAHHADFAIIGAGFAGLSAARRLQQIDPAAKITLIDASAISEGTAGRNSGFMVDLPHELTSENYAGTGDDRALVALNRQAIAFGDAAVHEYGIDPNYFDHSGKINGAYSEKARLHNQSYAAHLASLGERFEHLDAKSMQEITGSPHYRSGLYTPGTVTLQTAGYIRGLAAGLARGGVQIFENTPALLLQKQGADWLVQTPKGAISAAKVLLCVNGHLQSFGFAQNRLMQIFLYAVMTPELDQDQLKRLGGQARWGVTPSDPIGTTTRRIDRGQGGNRLIVRTCATLRPDATPSARELQRAQKVMRKKFDQRFPQLAGMKMEHAWAGHLCLARNGVSVMGEIEHGLYAACVQNGLGTTRGTLTGIGAAEMACGVVSAITTYFAGQDAPSKLPPRPFQEWGANAYLRTREWVARAE